MKRFWLLDFRVLFLLAFVSGCVAQAQTVATVSNNSVTAWSAKLFGSYTNLSTNSAFGFDLKFYYGETDGGTNVLDWDHASSSLYVEPTSTNDNYGTFNRTIVELEETNTYFYRAVADDFLDTLTWATQSLSFVSAGEAPTNMPDVTHKSVTVLPDGTLHEPANFFAANGIVPTSGVEQLFIRVTSNEMWIAMMVTGKFDRAGGDISGVTRLFDGLHLQPRSNAIFMVSRPIYFHSIDGSLSQTNSFHMWFNGTDMYGATSSVFGATIGRRFWTQFNDTNLLTQLLPHMTMDSMQITNRDSWAYLSQSSTNGFISSLFAATKSGSLASHSR